MIVVCPRCSHRAAVDEHVESTVCGQCGLTMFVTSTIQRLGAPASDTPPPALTEGAPRADESPPTEAVAIPEVFGRYRVVRFLGEGGYSRVYLARDLELPRSMAIKVPKTERFLDAEQLNDFLGDARTLVQLDHRHIVRVYDVGRDSSGVPYIVMQYIEGEGLDQRIKRDRLPLVEAVEIARKVALAVHHAHTRNFFHRDLKPSNILLAENGEPFVVDFGLAMAEDVQAMHEGEFAGTVPFMSPEQTRGDAHLIDGRSDIWSLGVVFYVLLTGRRPFGGERKQLLEAIQRRSPRPPRQLDEKIPQPLEDICLKCLRKPVDERYSSAFDLAADLEKWLESERAGSLQPPSMPKPRRLRTAVLAGVCLLFLVALGSAFMPPRDLREPTGNAHLDQFAVPGKWYGLLSEQPEVLVWSQAWHNATWSYDAEKEEIRIDSPDIGLLAMGQTNSEDFQFQVTMAKSAWTGTAGVFWGYRPVDGDPDKHECRCVLVQSLSGPKGQETWVNYGRYVFRPVPALPRSAIDAHMIAAEQVPAPALIDNVLHIQVYRGRLQNVQWRGKALETLMKNAAAEEKPRTSAAGRFGISSSHGATAFRDVRIRLDKKPESKHGSQEQDE